MRLPIGFVLECMVEIFECEICECDGKTNSVAKLTVVQG
jgi:hypothetical protein